MRYYIACIFLMLMQVTANAGTLFTDAELSVIRQHILNNMATEQHFFTKKNHGKRIHSIPGAVLASPSNHDLKFSQDYQFHWVRDAAITMDEWVSFYQQATPVAQQKLIPYLMSYIQFEHKAQQQISHSGEQTLGQPKYNIDGTIWEGKWARPQNDGAALRAITLMEIANKLHRNQDAQLLKMIATDLNYVADNWEKPTVDIWEEIKDKDVFFTKMVQRKALLMGADFFKRLGQKKLSTHYHLIAERMTMSIAKHWNDHAGYFSETISQQEYKGGGINSAVMLGLLYGNLNDPDDPFAIHSDKALMTIYKLRHAFSGLYQIPLIGRYPSDIYDGDQFVRGNPWILTSAALAQYYYSLAVFYQRQRHIVINEANKLFFEDILLEKSLKVGSYAQSGSPKTFNAIIQALVQAGDAILITIKQYGMCDKNNTCDHYAEQLDRVTGAQVSAKELTWGYTTLVAAMRVRKQVRP